MGVPCRFCHYYFSPIVTYNTHSIKTLKCATTAVVSRPSHGFVVQRNFSNVCILRIITVTIE